MNCILIAFAFSRFPWRMQGIKCSLCEQLNKNLSPLNEQNISEQLTKYLFLYYYAP
jgi:hypothetical protein